MRAHAHDTGACNIDACPRRSMPNIVFPQLTFIDIHQLIRIQHICFELAAVSIDTWMCINVCLVC